MEANMIIWKMLSFILNDFSEICYVIELCEIDNSLRICKS